MRFFKKHEPRNNPKLANGSEVIFTVADNPMIGYMAETNQQVIDGLVQLMTEGRYGITEITAEEFTRDYLEPKKNGRTSRPVWREEMGARESLKRGIPVMQQLGEQRVQESAAVVAAEKPLRTDGPTEAEYRAAGYKGEYPPEGYAPRAPGVPPVASATVEDVPKAAPQTGPDFRSTVKVGKRKAQVKPPINTQT